VRKLHCVTAWKRSTIGLLNTSDDGQQRGLADTVATGDTNDGTLRSDEGQSSDALGRRSLSGALG